MASPLGSFSTKVDPQLVDMDLNRDATQLVAATRSNLRILSIEESSFRDKQTIRVGKKSGLNFSLTGVAWKGIDENIIASGSSSGAVIVWNLALSTYSKQERMFTYHKRTCNSVAFHASEPLLISGSQDGTCIMYDTRKPDLSPSFFNCEEAVRHVQFFPSHYFLFIACIENGSIKVFDIRRPDHCERSFTCHNGPVFCSEFHPTMPNRLATAGRDRTIKVWDLQRQFEQPDASDASNHTNFRSSSSFYNTTTAATSVGVPLMAHSIPSIAPVTSISWRPHRSTTNHIACTSLSETRVCVYDVRRPFIPCASFEHNGEPIRAMWLGANNPESIISCGRDGTIIHNAMRDASKPTDFASPQALAIDHAYEQVLFSCSRQLLLNNSNSQVNSAAKIGELAMIAQMPFAITTDIAGSASGDVEVLSNSANFTGFGAADVELLHKSGKNTLSPLTFDTVAIADSDKSMADTRRDGDKLCFEESFKSELLVLSERALLSKFYAELNNSNNVRTAIDRFYADAAATSEQNLPSSSPVLPHSLLIKLTAQFVSLPAYSQQYAVNGAATTTKTGSRTLTNASFSSFNYVNVKQMCEHNALLALTLNKQVEAQTWRMLAVMLMDQITHVNNNNKSNGDHRSSFLLADQNAAKVKDRRRTSNKAGSTASTNFGAAGRRSRKTSTIATTTTDSEREMTGDDEDAGGSSIVTPQTTNNWTANRQKLALSSSNIVRQNTPPLNDMPMGAGELLFGEQTVPEDFDLAFLSSGGATVNARHSNSNGFDIDSSMLQFTNSQYPPSTSSSTQVERNALPTDSFYTRHDLKRLTATNLSSVGGRKAVTAATTVPPVADSTTKAADAIGDLRANNAMKAANDNGFPSRNYRVSSTVASNNDDDEADSEAETLRDSSSALLRTNFESKHFASKTNDSMPVALFNYDAVIAELVRFCVDRNDLQLACHIIIMLGNEHVRLLPGITEQLMSCWFTDYITLLRRLRSFSHANLVTMLCPVESVRTLNCVSTSIHVCCGQCGATMPSNNSSGGGGGPSPHRCAKCRHMGGLCAVCHLPVRGAMVWCQGCSHGGHWAHMLQWFKGGDGFTKEFTGSRDCPAGCGHMCEYAFRL